MHAMYQRIKQHKEWDLGKDTLAVFGLTALFSSLLIYSAVMMGFRRFQYIENIMGVFAPTLLFAALLVSLILFICSLRNSLPGTKVLCGVGGLLSIAGAVMFSMFITGYAATMFAVVLFAAVAGAGEVIVCCVWGRIGKHWSLEKALVIIVIAFALALGIELLISSLSEAVALGLFIICTVVAAMLPLFEPAASVSSDELIPEGFDSHETASKKKKQTHILKALQELALEPAIGVLVFAFCLGSMRALFWQAHNEYIVGSLGAVAIALFVLVVPRKQSLTRLFSVVIIPSCAVALLAVTNIVLRVGQGDFWAQSLLYLFFGLAIILTLATLCATAHGGEVCGDTLFSGMLALFAAASLAGQATAEGCSDSVIEAMIGVVIALYAVAVVVMRSVRIDKAWGAFAVFDGQNMQANEAYLHRSATAVPECTQGLQKFATCAQLPEGVAEHVSSDMASEGADTDRTYGEGHSQTDVLADGLNECNDRLLPENAPTSRKEACEAIAAKYGLTSREQEILALLARGHNGVYISEILFISPNTVRTHIHNIYRKLGVSSREEVLSMTNPEYQQAK